MTGSMQSNGVIGEGFAKHAKKKKKKSHRRHFRDKVKEHSRWRKQQKQNQMCIRGHVTSEKVALFQQQ